MSSIKLRIEDPIQWLREEIADKGIGPVLGLYLGVYRGVVVDVKDPEQRGRCRIRIPSIGHWSEDDVSLNVWALPAQNGLSVGDSGQMHGVYFPPDIGDQLFVMFERGDTASPIYFGGWVHRGGSSVDSPTGVANADKLTEEESLYKGIRTSSGHLIKFSDKPDDVSILIAKGDGEGSEEATLITLGKDSDIVMSTKSGNQLFMDDAKGTVSILGKDGSLMSVGSDSCQFMTKSGASYQMKGGDININCPGNITMSCNGKISLKAAVDLGPGPVYEEAVMGMTFATTEYLVHMHQTTVPGTPTSPQLGAPLVPMAGLSMNVKVST